MKQSVYWCDICYKKGANIDGTLKRKFYSCYLTRDWLGHKDTKKHKKLCKEVEEDEDNIECKWCNIKFSKEGYALHSERNKPLWDMKKIGSCKGMICNEFINEDDEKRYSSFDDYKASKLPKSKAKRTGVGKCSPKTGITRPPNKPKGWNDNIKMEITIEPNKKEDLKEGEWMTIEDKEEPNEKEWELIDEFGNRLYFEGHCDTCTLPINDEDYSSRLLTYLDIDVCDCD
tara:strand:+ start:344 stop:1033 length:690 start_codon:yes stop_codon:yes gene_type:complete